MHVSTTYECKKKVLVAHRQRLKRLSTAMRSTKQPVAWQYTAAGILEPETADVASLRKELAARKEELQARRHTLVLRHVHRREQSTTAFFQRVSTKYLDNGITSMVDAAGVRTRDPERIAEIMADGWEPPMNSPDDPDIDFEQLFEGIELPTDDVAAAALDDAITLDELEAATKSYKRGKAASLGRLNNDRFKDNAADLAPVLLETFRAWSRTGVHSATFVKEDVFCLKKKPSLCGIRLRAGSRSHLLNMAGCTDDTAVYLASAAKIPAALQVMNEFKMASRLRMNVSPSVRMALRKSGRRDLPALLMNRHEEYL